MMENHKNGVVRSTREPDISLNDEQSSRSVVISNLPANTERDKLYIHFQRTGQGGGEIEHLKLLEDGRAILTYEEVTVAESVLQRKHEFGSVVLNLKPYKTVELKKQGKPRKSWKPFKGETNDKIKKPDTHHNMRTDEGDANAAHKDLECESLNLDVQPKLMYILRKEIQEIEDKYKIKIDNTPNRDKAVLSPVGNEKLFEEGKKEFITLYQKTFQEMDEKRFELDIDDSAVKKTFKELMDQFDVVIDQKGKEICIYGRNSHVGMAMQRLQGKPRRSRKAFKGETNDELKKPDTYAQLPKTLKHTLENGVTVSVYQGDITNQHVDVIVNAANERLDHGGGVAGAIVKQGGYQIQQQSTQLVQQYGLLPVGQVAYTGPGRLPCKIIIHAVGPQWRVHGPEGSRQLIFDACWNSFVLASQHGAGSIVLPGISFGIYGVPKEICTDMMFTAAEAFSCEATTQNRLRDIRFVNIDSPTNEAFRQEFYKRYVEKRSSGFENGPQNGKDSMTDNQNNGGQTNKGSQMPAVNPSKGQLQGERVDKPRSYATAVAAGLKRRETSQPKMDSKLLLKSKAPTNVQSSGRSSFKQGYKCKSHQDELLGNKNKNKKAKTKTKTKLKKDREQEHDRKFEKQEDEKRTKEELKRDKTLECYAEAVSKTTDEVSIQKDPVAEKIPEEELGDVTKMILWKKDTLKIHKIVEGSQVGNMFMSRVM